MDRSDLYSHLETISNSFTFKLFALVLHYNDKATFDFSVPDINNSNRLNLNIPLNKNLQILSKFLDCLVPSIS